MTRGKWYTVEIEAEDFYGRKVRFSEDVYYPHILRLTEQEYWNSLWPWPSYLLTVPEYDREAKAIEQVRIRNPHLRNVRALSSIARDY